jgi:transmembrane sensor
MDERLRSLFKKYLDNTCTYKELEEFFGLINDSRGDETLRQQISKLYRELSDTAQPASHIDERGKLVVTEPEWLPGNAAPPQLAKPKKWIAAISIAAVFVVIAGTFWIVRNASTKQQSRALASVTKKTTDRSESKFLLLSDSTEVWLNAASSLEFPDQFNPKIRVVYLKGEAFFDVKHADKIPFIIHTGKVSTTVIGTAFNIKAYPGEKNITVSVRRGTVKVSRGDGWFATLTKGQQLKVEEEKKEVLERNIPATEVAAWQHGTLVYDDENLGDIISDLKRVYNVEISLDNRSLHDLKISTSFKKEIGIDQALQVLCKLTDTELKQNGSEYILD